VFLPSRQDWQSIWGIGCLNIEGLLYWSGAGCCVFWRFCWLFEKFMLLFVVVVVVVV
jgi:hypothetical protein